MNETDSKGPEPIVAPADSLDPRDRVMGVETAKYLEVRANESFKREMAVEEGIWRSLPLFIALILAGAGLLGQAIDRLPPLRGGFYSIGTHALLGCSSLLFGISSWWLWQIVRPREFEYPPNDVEVAKYADRLAQFHASSAGKGADFDAAVAHDLRVYNALQAGEVAASHFHNNQARLSARGQVLVFLLAGFVLAILCDGIILGSRMIYGTMPTGAAESEQSERATDKSRGTPPTAADRPADSPASADRQGRRVANQAQPGASGAVQVMAGDGKPSGDKTPPVTTMAKPTAPPKQIVTKIELGHTRPKPAKPPKT
jgi:hypothetical protein